MRVPGSSTFRNHHTMLEFEMSGDALSPKVVRSPGRISGPSSVDKSLYAALFVRRWIDSLHGPLLPTSGSWRIPCDQ